MTNAKIYTNNSISFNGKHVGYVLSVHQNGQTMDSAVAGKRFPSCVFYTGRDRTSANRHDFEIPVYVSETPDTHSINPVLVEAIQKVIK